MRATESDSKMERLTVNEVIREYPRTVEVFNLFGIDACCGGSAGVREAAVRDGADGDRLIEALAASIGSLP